MNGLKIAELVISAITAITMIAKAVLKLIGYFGRLRNRKPAMSAV
jgi:hypothetical protein